MCVCVCVFFSIYICGKLDRCRISHPPSRSLIWHVSGTVELLLVDVMNADTQPNRELVEGSPYCPAVEGERERREETGEAACGEKRGGKTQLRTAREGHNAK